MIRTDRIGEKISEHHEIAAAHLGHAADHHRLAAEQQKLDEPEVAAHHAHAAHGHRVLAAHHADEAARLHAEHYARADVE